MKGSRPLKTSASLSSSKIGAGTTGGRSYSSLQQPQVQSGTAKIEDEFISNLQKQIYYLELEMKLMKDKEVETKNKVGGYEILFRDGVPLNEHFLALKTKYTGEKEQCEKIILDANSELNSIENENKYLQAQLEETNANYYDMMERINQNSDFYNKKIFELNSKLINEVNSKESHLKDKEILGKSLYKFSSENTHYTRTLEKNKLFQDNKDEKNKQLRERNLEKFEEVDKLVLRSILEQEMIERKLEQNQKGRTIETENSELIMTMNKLERDLHMAKAKISEYENIQILNKKYLLDEELTKKIYEKENKKLNEELDGLVKLNEETLRQKVKENEKNQSIIIKNNITNKELQMNLLLNKFKTEEAKARELLEEKNTISQRIVLLNEVIENQSCKESETKRELVDVRNAIDEIKIIIEENESNLNSISLENEKVRQNSERYEADIKVLKKKIDELQQKIELNTILRDIDINELKILSQNNAMVNNSINSLMSKWDKVQSKLQELEGKSGNKE
jgi:hypothetical protein